MIPVKSNRFNSVRHGYTLVVGDFPTIERAEHERYETMARVVSWARLDGHNQYVGGVRTFARCSVLNHNETWFLPWFIRLVDHCGARPTDTGKCARSACLGYVGGVALSRSQGFDELPVRWVVRARSDIA